MITLRHTRNLYLYSYEGIKPETKENVRYAFGDLPPNYPVPAIPLRVSIKDYRVAVYHGKVALYYYDYEMGLIT